MDIFCQDTKLNLSPYYLKPGFAFGGSCLPKDVRALTYKARDARPRLPLLNAILPSNERQIERGYRADRRAQGKRKIGMLGFSFKAGTDDLRESPLVELIERLHRQGLRPAHLRRNVNLAALTGANRDYILQSHSAHLAPHGRVDRRGARSTPRSSSSATPPQSSTASPAGCATTRLIVDLVRIKGERPHPRRYEGICW